MTAKNKLTFKQKGDYLFEIANNDEQVVWTFYLSQSTMLWWCSPAPPHYAVPIDANDLRQIADKLDELNGVEK